MKSQDGLVESNSAASASLKQIVQRLMQEKVSLTAAITVAEQSAAESVKKVKLTYVCFLYKHTYTINTFIYCIFDVL